MPDSLAMTKGAMEPSIPEVRCLCVLPGCQRGDPAQRGQKSVWGPGTTNVIEVAEAENDSPFLCSPVPAGAKLGPVFVKKGDIYPKGGFKREEEVDLEDMRTP